MRFLKEFSDNYILKEKQHMNNTSSMEKSQACN